MVTTAAIHRLILLSLLGVVALGCAQAQPAQPAADAFAPRIAQPPVEARTLAHALHEEVNVQRHHHRMPALAWNDTLEAIGRRYSADMATRSFFAHVDPEGRTPTDRARAAGYSCVKEGPDHVTTGVGENLFATSLYGSIRVVTEGDSETRLYAWKELEAIVREVVDGWMNSPGHRRNILEARFDREGLGVVITENDRVYITQVFC